MVGDDQLSFFVMYIFDSVMAPWPKCRRLIPATVVWRNLVIWIVWTAWTVYRTGKRNRATIFSPPKDHFFRPGHLLIRIWFMCTTRICVAYCRCNIWSQSLKMVNKNCQLKIIYFSYNFCVSQEYRPICLCCHPTLLAMGKIIKTIHVTIQTVTKRLKGCRILALVNMVRYIFLMNVIIIF